MYDKAGVDDCYDEKYDKYDKYNNYEHYNSDEYYDVMIDYIFEFILWFIGFYNIVVSHEFFMIDCQSKKWTIRKCG